MVAAESSCCDRHGVCQSERERAGGDGCATNLFERLAWTGTKPRQGTFPNLAARMSAPKSGNPRLGHRGFDKHHVIPRKRGPGGAAPEADQSPAQFQHAAQGLSLRTAATAQSAVARTNIAHPAEISASEVELLRQARCATAGSSVMAPRSWTRVSASRRVDHQWASAICPVTNVSIAAATVSAARPNASTKPSRNAFTKPQP